MTVELLKLFAEHEEIHNDHSDFYELAEAYDFCTPWCHLAKDCSVCKEDTP